MTLSVEAWHTLGEDIPVRIRLQGDSMRPLIRRDRDTVTIRPVHRPLRRGDIVLLADDRGRYVVHRVRKVTKAGVITQGDHCLRPDAPLEYSRVWGLVTRVDRGSRSIPVDNAAARLLGRLWLTLLPLRRIYYKMKNREDPHGTH